MIGLYLGVWDRGIADGESFAAFTYLLSFVALETFNEAVDAYCNAFDSYCAMLIANFDIDPELFANVEITLREDHKSVEFLGGKLAVNSHLLPLLHWIVNP